MGHLIGKSSNFSTTKTRIIGGRSYLTNNLLVGLKCWIVLHRQFFYWNKLSYITSTLALLRKWPVYASVNGTKDIWLFKKMDRSNCYSLDERFIQRRLLHQEKKNDKKRECQYKPSITLYKGLPCIWLFVCFGLFLFFCLFVFVLFCLLLFVFGNRWTEPGPYLLGTNL